jgi:hydroxyacylglutathione hydrolase
MRLGRIGYDDIAGYLGGGMKALKEHSNLVCCTKRVLAPVLREYNASPNPPLVLDVRSESEVAVNRISGSVNIPLQRLKERIDEVPSGKMIVVHCESGYRPAIASSLLERHGLCEHAELIGGMEAWEATKP